MEVVATGTAALSAGNTSDVILDIDSSSPGVYIVELELSDMDNLDVLQLLVEQKPHATATKNYWSQEFFRGAQSAGKWQSAPICSLDELTITLYTHSGTTQTIYWKIFRVGVPVSEDDGSRAFLAGETETIEATTPGSYVMVVDLTNMDYGDLVTIKQYTRKEATGDVELAHEAVFENRQYWGVKQTVPIVVDEIIRCTIKADTVTAASLTIDWHLMRV